MHLQKLRSFAGLVALLQAAGFFPVCKHKILQAIGLIGRVAALVTCKRLLFSVFGLVPVENNTLCAGIVTLLASEMLFSFWPFFGPSGGQGQSKNANLAAMRKLLMKMGPTQLDY